MGSPRKTTATPPSDAVAAYHARQRAAAEQVAFDTMTDPTTPPEVRELARARLDESARRLDMSKLTTPEKLALRDLIARVLGEPALPGTPHGWLARALGEISTTVVDSVPAPVAIADSPPPTAHTTAPIADSVPTRSPAVEPEPERYTPSTSTVPSEPTGDDWYPVDGNPDHMRRRIRTPLDDGDTIPETPSERSRRIWTQILGYEPT